VSKVWELLGCVSDVTKVKRVGRYILYILRWVALAIPGAWFLVQVQKVISSTYLAMICSQGILGAVVYFIDRWIFQRGRSKS